MAGAVSETRDRAVSCLMMRLPFVRSRQETDPTVAEALRRIEDRLDRLIVIGERTNELLARVEPPGAAKPRKTDEHDQPKAARAGERAAKQVPRKSPSPKRAKSAGSEPQGQAGRAEEPARVAGTLKLHEAIIRVLLDAGEALGANDIAARIRERTLFVPPRSGHELRGGQVSARVGNATYRDRFVRREGRIWLADPEGERLRLTSP